VNPCLHIDILCSIWHDALSIDLNVDGAEFFSQLYRPFPDALLFGHINRIAAAMKLQPKRYGKRQSWLSQD
jgi:hypothetical protein